jgi:hypothetical protein
VEAATVVAVAALLLSRDRPFSHLAAGILSALTFALTVHLALQTRLITPTKVAMTFAAAVAAVVLWSSAVAHPQIRYRALDVRFPQSSDAVGEITVSLQNVGDEPAHVRTAIADGWGPFLRDDSSQRELIATRLEQVLDQRSAQPLRVDFVPDGQRFGVRFEFPFTPDVESFLANRKSIYLAGRFFYSDHLWPRQTTFCVYRSVRHTEWFSCPFLNEE